MDGRGWSAGLRKMEVGTKGAAARMAGSMAGMIGGVFAVGFLASATRRIVQHADQIHKTAVRIGASTDTIQKFDFAATQSGATMTDVEKSFINTAKAMESAKQGLTTHIRAFQAFGITMQMLNVMSPEQVFLKVADAIEKAGGAMDNAKSLQDIMGRGGAAMIPAFVSGFTGLAGSAPKGIDEATIQSLVKFNDELDRLKREALPAASGAVAALADAFSRANQSWRQPVDQVQKSTGEFGSGSVQPAINTNVSLWEMLLTQIRREDETFGSSLSNTEIQMLFAQDQEVSAAARGGAKIRGGKLVREQNMDRGVFLGSNLGQGMPQATTPGSADPATADAAAAAAAKAWSKPSLQLNSLQRIGAAVTQSADPIAIEKDNNKLLKTIAKNTKKLADETEGI